ncbi:MAG: sulfotransferase [Halioglobus sp.]
MNQQAHTMKPDPFFILGHPRSGTSLLRSILNSHDKIVVPPECGFVQWLHARYRDFDKIQIDGFVSDLSLSRKIEGWNLDFEALRHFLIRKTPRSYSELCSLVYQFYGESLGKDLLLWGDKNNYYIHHLGEIVSIYPGAQFIHIIRNPKDVVRSHLDVIDLPSSTYKPNFSGSIREMTENWIDNNNKVSVFLEKGGFQKLEVHYEALISDAAKVTQEICDFLCISSEGVLGNFESKKYFDEPETTMEWKAKLTGSILPNNFNTYSERLTENDAMIIDKLLSDRVLEFNYIEF